MSDDLWLRLDELSAELVDLYPQVGAALAAELHRKTELAADLIGQGVSVSAADREAQHAARTLTEQVWMFQYRVRALEEERDHLRFTIKHRGGR